MLDDRHKNDGSKEHSSATGNSLEVSRIHFDAEELCLDLVVCHVNKKIDEQQSSRFCNFILSRR